MKNYKRDNLRNILADVGINPYSFWFDDDDFWFDDDDCWFEPPWGLYWDFEGNAQITTIYHQKIRGIWRSIKIVNPEKIDMLSFYSKENLRQVKIDKILEEDLSNKIENIIKWNDINKNSK